MSQLQGIDGVTQVDEFQVWEMAKGKMVGVVKLKVNDNANRKGVTSQVESIMKKAKVKNVTVHLERGKKGSRRTAVQSADGYEGQADDEGKKDE